MEDWQKERISARILKMYFEDLYNIDTQEKVAVNMCGFDGFRRRANWKS